LVTHGAVSNVTLPGLGRPIGGGDLVASVVILDKSIEIRSPVAGSVVLVNERLLEEPALIGDDPFVSGWLFEVQLSYDETLEGVMDVDSYLRIGN
jgi:glycine cleavage system H protein